jgi:ERCC4-type nuclease
VLVSPAEPAKLRELGSVSSRPEKYGVDFMFVAQAQWCGIQRKEIADLVASIYDGRLAKEIGQMKQLARAALVVEGSVKFTMDGNLMLSGFGQGMTKKQFRGILWSIQGRGIWVDRTDNMGETAETVRWMADYLSKQKHGSLETRPGPTAVWGKPDNDDYARHLVMGLPGVGSELAARIVDKFGVPFGWRIQPEDLVTIPGIGKKKAMQLWEALEYGESVDEGTA